MNIRVVKCTTQGNMPSNAGIGIAGTTLPSLASKNTLTLIPVTAKPSEHTHTKMCS
jgi:hypothetical protein